jgi:hypothetical protein
MKAFALLAVVSMSLPISGFARDLPSGLKAAWEERQAALKYLEEVHSMGGVMPTGDDVEAILMVPKGIEIAMAGNGDSPNLSHLIPQFKQAAQDYLNQNLLSEDQVPQYRLAEKGYLEEAKEAEKRLEDAEVAFKDGMINLSCQNTELAKKFERAKSIQTELSGGMRVLETALRDKVLSKHASALMRIGYRIYRSFDASKLSPTQKQEYSEILRAIREGIANTERNIRNSNKEIASVSKNIKLSLDPNAKKTDREIRSDKNCFEMVAVPSTGIATRKPFANVPSAGFLRSDKFGGAGAY